MRNRLALRGSCGAYPTALRQSGGDELVRLRVKAILLQQRLSLFALEVLQLLTQLVDEVLELLFAPGPQAPAPVPPPSPWQAGLHAL
jgi:hypothetical protein